MGNLSDIRKQIDDIDAKIVHLLNERWRIVNDVKQQKLHDDPANNNAIPAIIRPFREYRLLKHLIHTLNHPHIPSNAIIDIWRSMLNASVSTQTETTLIYWTSHHDDAYQHYVTKEYGLAHKICFVDNKNHLADAISATQHTPNNGQHIIACPWQYVNDWRFLLDTYYIINIFPRDIKCTPTHAILSLYDHDKMPNDPSIIISPSPPPNTYKILWSYDGIYAIYNNGTISTPLNIMAHVPLPAFMI